MKTLRFLTLTISLLLASCNLPGGSAALPPATVEAIVPTLEVPTATLTASATSTLAPTETFTPTPTNTDTPAPSATFTETLTPEPSATPTYAFPQVVVNQQAHCRYGPAKSHLHAADLYPGDTGTVRGRFQYSQWLYIKFDKLNYFCWVASNVVTVTGDISLINYAEVHLPGPSVLYKPPQNVVATRNGSKVTITWDQVKMTSDDDRGYFLELFVCQDGNYIWWTFSYPDQFTTSYTVKDEKGCPAFSGGQLYAVEKHGYTSPVTIAWPLP